MKSRIIPDFFYVRQRESRFGEGDVQAFTPWSVKVSLDSRPKIQNEVIYIPQNANSVCGLKIGLEVVNDRCEVWHQVCGCVIGCEAS